jgi:hypothetical protein
MIVEGGGGVGWCTVQWGETMIDVRSMIDDIDAAAARINGDANAKCMQCIRYGYDH